MGGGNQLPIEGSGRFSATYLSSLCTLTDSPAPWTKPCGLARPDVDGGVRACARAPACLSCGRVMVVLPLSLRW